MRDDTTASGDRAAPMHSKLVKRVRGLRPVYCFPRKLSDELDFGNRRVASGSILEFIDHDHQYSADPASSQSKYVLPEVFDLPRSKDFVKSD